MAIVRLCEVSKSFREGEESVYAIADVSLVVHAGEFLALCGPSGSGKTTLLNLIGCLDRPTKGAVWVDGEEVSSLRQRQLTSTRRNKVGFIFQDFNLFPALNAQENIEYPLWLLGIQASERRRRVRRIAVPFGIEGLLGHLPAQLSRGQQQRVAVARAVAHRPRLVLGDEFTANLDRETGAALMDFLQELNRREGITFVYASHDPAMVGQARRVVRLRDGCLEPDIPA